jgi:dTDP-6-deoxy-L-talose 4-dehydrogenase (NAD+)
LVELPTFSGAVNICDGTPTSVRRLAENHVKKRGSSIRLNLGFYPYPDYEPMAFWGNGERYRCLAAGLSGKVSP